MKYKRLLFLCDVNAGMEDSTIKIFCGNFKPIDLILTNGPGSFQNSCVTETGLSDFY